MLTKLLAGSPQDVPLRVMLADALRKGGKFSESADEYKKVLELDAANEEALYGLGTALRKQGKTPEALADYEVLLKANPNHAGALAGTGLIMLDNGDHENALAAFGKALDIDAVSSEALAGKAIALYKTGKTKEAEAVFQEVIGKKPDDPGLMVQYASFLENKGNLRGAKDAFEKAAKKDPHLLDAQVGLGEVLYKMGNVSECFKVLSAAVDEHPGNLALIMQVASLYRQQKLYDDASKMLARGSALDANHPKLLVELGRTALDSGAYDDALAFFNKVNEQDKNNLDGYIWRGTTYFRKGEVQKGVEEFKAAMGINPKSVEVLTAYGRAYIDRGMFYEGIQELQKIFEFSPKEKMVHYMIGLGFLHGGFGDVATEEFKAELELNPRHAASYFNLGLCYSKSGQAEDAAKEYAKALELDPNLLDARYNLALLDAKNSKVEQAIQGFEKILEIKKDDTASLYNLGVLYAKSQQADKAIDIFKQVVELDGQNADARDNLAVLYEKKGMVDDAIAQYQAILSLPELDSSDAVQVNLGILFMKKGDIRAAKESFKKAAEVNPRNAQAYFHLGLAGEYNDAGERYGAGFDGQSSIQNYEKAIEIDPGSKDALANMKAVREKLGIKPPVAAQSVDAQRLADDDKTKVRELMIAGEIYFNRGELENASAEWSKALELDPQNGDIQKNLAMVDGLRKRDLEQAAEEKNKQKIAEEQDARDEQKRNEIAVLLEAGQVLFDRGDYSGAIGEWQKVGALDPRNAVALSNIDRAKEAIAAAEQATQDQETRQQAEVREAAEKEKALKDQDIAKQLSTARIYLEEGYFEEAMQTWQKVLSVDPGNAEAQKGIADAREKLEGRKTAGGVPVPEPATAPEAAAGAAEVSPLQARLNAQRIADSLSTGDVMARVGDIESAIIEYEKVLRIDPNNVEAKRRITEARAGSGIAQEKQRQMEDMKRFEQEKAAAQQEKKRKVTEYLTAGEVKFNKGQFEGAIEAWNNIIAFDPTNDIARRRIAEAKELKIARDVRQKREDAAREFAKQKAMLRIKEAQVKQKKAGEVGAPIAKRPGAKKKLHMAKKRDAFLDDKYLEETLGSITGDSGSDEEMSFGE